MISSGSMGYRAPYFNYNIGQTFKLKKKSHFPLAVAQIWSYNNRSAQPALAVVKS